MADMIKVPNLKMLNALPSIPQEGEVAFCEDEQKYYMFHEQWIPVEATMTDEGLKLNLYDLNKQIINQLLDYTDEKIKDLKEVIRIWKTSKEDSYFMLYGKEIGYFSLFVADYEGQYSTFEEEVVACLNDFDAIKEYDVNEKAIELWVKTGEDVTALYLFGYDAGVVGYNG